MVVAPRRKREGVAGCPRRHGGRWPPRSARGLSPNRKSSADATRLRAEALNLPATAEIPAIIQHSAFSIQHCPRNARAVASARRSFSIQHSAFSIRHCRPPHAIIFRPFASLPNSSTMQASPRPPVFPPLSIHRRGAAMGLKLYFFDFEPRIELTKPSISDRFTHIRPRMRETGTGDHRCFSDAMDNWKN